MWGNEIISEESEKKKLTIEEKLLLHLSKFKHHNDDYFVSELVTEQGIVKVLSCSWGLVSAIMKKNIEKGYIYRLKSKVERKKYKQFTFFLTKKGRRHMLKLNKVTK